MPESRNLQERSNATSPVKVTPSLQVPLESKLNKSAGMHRSQVARVLRKTFEHLMFSLENRIARSHGRELYDILEALRRVLLLEQTVPDNTKASEDLESSGIEDEMQPHDLGITMAAFRRHFQRLISALEKRIAKSNDKELPEILQALQRPLNSGSSALGRLVPTVVPDKTLGVLKQFQLHIKEIDDRVTSDVKEVKQKVYRIVDRIETLQAKPDGLSANHHHTEYKQELQLLQSHLTDIKNQTLQRIDECKQESRSRLNALRDSMKTLQENTKKSINEAQEQVHTTVHDLRDHAESLQIRIDSFVNKIGEERFAAIQELREHVDETLRQIGAKADDAEYKSYVQLRNRLNTATKNASRKDTATLYIDSKQWRKRLNKAGLFFNDETLSNCANVIRQGRALFLLGPPQTGKSSLACALAALSFDKPISEGEELCFRVVAQRNWQQSDVIGGDTVLSERIAPQLGCFSEAVVKSALGETRWLVIEELNFANMEEVLSDLYPILDKGFSDNLFFSHPRLKLDGEPFNIRIANSFRFIATMNDKDDNRYQLPQALTGKVGCVHIRPPSPEIENRILAHRLSMDYHIADDKSASDVREHSVAFMQDLRDLAITSGATGCCLGAGFTLRLSWEWYVGISKGQGIEQAGDQAITTVIVPALKGLWPEARSAVLEKVITRQRYPEAFHCLQMSVRQ